MYNDNVGGRGLPAPKAWRSAWECVGMTTGLYLAIMLGVIALCVIVTLPSLLRHKCRKCGTRNDLEARQCSHCQASLEE